MPINIVGKIFLNELKTSLSGKKIEFSFVTSILLYHFRIEKLFTQMNILSFLDKKYSIIIRN